jgi:hypothetical protein
MAPGSSFSVGAECQTVSGEVGAVVAPAVLVRGVVVLRGADVLDEEV